MADEEVRALHRRVLTGDPDALASLLGHLRRTAGDPVARFLALTEEAAAASETVVTLASLGRLLRSVDVRKDGWAPWRWYRSANPVHGGARMVMLGWPSPTMDLVVVGVRSFGLGSVGGIGLAWPELSLRNRGTVRRQKRDDNGEPMFMDGQPVYREIPTPVGDLYRAWALASPDAVADRVWLTRGEAQALAAAAEELTRLECDRCGLRFKTPQGATQHLARVHHALRRGSGRARRRRGVRRRAPNPPSPLVPGVPTVTSMLLRFAAHFLAEWAAKNLTPPPPSSPPPAPPPA